MDDYGQSYDSPVLVHLDERMGEPVPGRDVACTTCPVSLWYWRGNNELVCFCSALHQDTWDDRRGDALKPVRLCDARQQALARMVAEGQ